MALHLPSARHGDLEESAHQLESLQSQFHRKFAGPNSQHLITKHMPKSCEQSD